MSIATAITNLQGKIANAYTAIQEKGGTLPATQNAENLSATIVDLPSGGSSSKWGMTLDEILYSDNGTLNPFGGVSSDINLSGVVKLGPYALYQAFMGNTDIRSASFPDLTTIAESGLYTAFSACTNLTSISFPELSSLQNAGILTSAFVGCTSLVSASFPKLVEVFGGLAGTSLGTTLPPCYQLFTDCTNLSSVSFPVLSCIGSRQYSSYRNSAFRTAFKNTKLTSLTFPELVEIYNDASSTEYSTFKNNNQVSVYYFPKLTVLKKSWTATTNDSLYIFDNYAKELHFGAENQAIIEASAGYANRWGAGSGCQVFFDL